MVRTPGHQTIRDEVHVPKDGNGKDGHVFDVFYQLHRGTVVRGRVVDEHGEPNLGASVSVAESERKGMVPITSSDATEPDGRVEVGGLTHLPFTYAVSAAGYTPLHKPTVFGDKDDAPNIDPERIVLRRDGKIRVTVRDADGFFARQYPRTA